ncbi:MAG TPA: hypothetical protein VGL76_04565 [Gaiellaceae bacterium]
MSTGLPAERRGVRHGSGFLSVCEPTERLVDDRRQSSVGRIGKRGRWHRAGCSIPVYPMLRRSDVPFEPPMHRCVHDTDFETHVLIRLVECLGDRKQERSGVRVHGTMRPFGVELPRILAPGGWVAPASQNAIVMSRSVEREIEDKLDLADRQ